MTLKKFIKVLVAAICVAPFVILLIEFVCSGSIIPSDYSDVHQTPEGFEYTIFYVEGMPCLFFGEKVGGTYPYSGLTCDWSRWQGLRETQ